MSASLYLLSLTYLKLKTINLFWECILHSSKVVCGVLKTLKSGYLKSHYFPKPFSLSLKEEISKEISNPRHLLLTSSGAFLQGLMHSTAFKHFWVQKCLTPPSGLSLQGLLCFVLRNKILIFWQRSAEVITIEDFWRIRNPKLIAKEPFWIT